MNKSIVAITALALMSGAASAETMEKTRQDAIRRDLQGHGREACRRQHHRGRLVTFGHDRIHLVKQLAVELELGRRIVGECAGRRRQRFELLVDGGRAWLHQRQHHHRQWLHDLDLVTLTFIERIKT